MKRTALYLALQLVACAVLVACGTSQNYLEASRPVFRGDFQRAPKGFDGALKVVSYNISFALNIEQAIHELTTVEALMNADIILLQEMDETGTEAIARALDYQYAYIPATVHPRHDRNFGNAILSRWPIEHVGRVVLPHVHPINQQQRIATRANVRVSNLLVQTYSVHTETFAATVDQRQDQVNALVEDIGNDAPFAVVGGDFNTGSQSTLSYLDESLGSVGLIRATEGIGSTAQYGPLQLSLDHIYGRGFQVLDAGKVESATASDHLPIWTMLRAKS